MNDASGVHPALGIETVEWLAQGGENLPPALKPVPSAAAQTLPAATERAGRPPDSSREAEIMIERRLRSSELELESPRLREAQARATAEQLVQRIEELEQRVERDRGEAERFAAAIADHEQARRRAEQRAHSETALRRELEDRLGTWERDRQLARHALGELAAAEERLRELEQALERLRRRAREAEQAAASAQSARVRAERLASDAARGGAPVATGPPRSNHAGLIVSRILECERELVRVRAGQERRVPSEPAQARSAPSGAAAAPVFAEATAAAGPTAPDVSHALIDALRRELDTRAAIEARLRAELITTQGKLEARLAIESSLSLTLSEMRGELEQARSAMALEGAARARSERRVDQLELDLLAQRERADRAYRSSEAVGVSEAVPVSVADPPSMADPALAVQPERLNEALSRLREMIPAQKPAAEPVVGAAPRPGAASAEPARAGRAWLEPAFRSLVRRDAALAGRLVLDLLPAQRAACPRPVSYDLVLDERRCVQLTVFGGPPEIRFADAPRPASMTDFKAKGDAARLARLLAAGRIRAHLGIRVARVKGRRDALSALRALVQAPLTLGDLYRAGVRLEPALALELVALMIAPQWTVGERFSIAHEQYGRAGSVLHVRGGLALRVSEAWPADPADTTITCPDEVLLDVLSGRDTQELEVRGDARPLGLVRAWLQRAQSG